MKCLVTGATGFIGRRLCQQLLSQGHSVIALSRSGAQLDNGPVTVGVDFNVADPDPELLQGVDVVLHLAGIAHRDAGPAEYERLNHQFTLRLARLAAAAGASCFIFASSVKAMGPAQSSSPRAEHECATPLDSYGLSKWQAECGLRNEFSNAAMSVAILRPALVYGAQAKGNLYRLARAVRWGLPRPPPLGRRSMIAVDDLVDLLCDIAGQPGSGVNTWIACGSEAYSTRELYDLLRRACGKGRGRAWLPHWAWRTAAALLDILSGHRGEPTYEKLFGTEIYSNAAVVAATAWRPRVRLEDVVASMAISAQPDPGKPRT